MFLLAVFAVTFAGGFFIFRAKGQKTADCVHKGLVAGVLVTMLAFILAVMFSLI